jgi:aspartate/methionine/tyrosine aminotransferase
MEWAKTRPRARFDLAGSNLLHLTPDELPGLGDAIDFAGPNEEGYEPLLAAIGGHYGVDASHVALGTGTSGANFLAFSALLSAGDDVLVERPGYDPLIAAVRVIGANVVRFDRPYESKYAVDPSRLASALTPRTRLIVLTSPHNPTSAVISPEVLDEIGKLAKRHGAFVLVDEVYLDTVPPEQRTPAASRSDVFLSTTSFTKAYGLNALRCGWIVGSPDVITRIRRMRGIVDGIGSPVLERLATLAFKSLPDLAARARAIVDKNRRVVTAFIDSRPELEWVRSDAGTLAFPRLRGVPDAGPFIDRLLSEFDTAVVPGRFFDAPAHFRIAFGGAHDNLTGGLSALGRALDSLGSR